MAAYRQAKRMQRGVKLGYKQFGNGVNDTRFESAPIPIGTSDFSLELYMNSYGSNQSYPFAFNKRVYSVYAKGSIFLHNSNSYENGIYSILMEAPESNADSIYPSWQAPTADEKYLLTITRQGTTVKAYINGELKVTKEQSEVKDMGDLQLAIANSSDVGFVRVWNMCLSADDVTAHCNNGDPMGYVVPKAMRRPEIAFPSGIYTESSRTFTQNNTQSTTATYNNPQANGFSGSYMRFDAVTTVSLYNAFWSNILKRAYPIKVTMEYRCNYDLYEGNTVQASGRMLATANDGDAKVVAIYYPNSLGNANLGIGNNNAPDAWLEIRVTSIESVGLLAEYLPQNLMESRKGPAVEPKAKIYEFNIGDEYYKSVLIQAKYPYDCIYRVDYVVDEWDYQPKPIGSVGFLGLTGATILTPDGKDWSTLEKAKVGESRTLLVKMPGSGTPALYIYGGNDDETATARHLKVTIKGITPVSVPISWLDSAKQLPLSDEYMEPLFQSIGGYDMAANGAPEILYNE